jgi:hypothetical protein
VAMARGQLWNPGRVTSAVGSRYQRTGEGTAEGVDSMRAIVDCRVSELAVAQL